MRWVATHGTESCELQCRGATRHGVGGGREARICRKPPPETCPLNSVLQVDVRQTFPISDLVFVPGQPDCLDPTYYCPQILEATRRSGTLMLGPLLESLPAGATVKLPVAVAPAGPLNNCSTSQISTAFSYPCGGMKNGNSNPIVLGNLVSCSNFGDGGGGGHSGSGGGGDLRPWIPPVCDYCGSGDTWIQVGDIQPIPDWMPTCECMFSLANYLELCLLPSGLGAVKKLAAKRFPAPKAIEDDLKSASRAAVEQLSEFSSEVLAKMEASIALTPSALANLHPCEQHYCGF